VGLYKRARSSRPAQSLRPRDDGILCDRGADLLRHGMAARSTRAQAMDVLSSQANIGGYKAVILARTNTAAHADGS